MKKLITSLILTVMLSTDIFGANVGTGAVQEPKIAATGAILMDFESGRVLWGKNEDMPLAMASTTKIMTAVLALEMADMEDTVTVSSKASLAPEVKMRLSAGENIKLGDLMYALMLQSYNDAAVAIAEHIGGDVDSFCNMMTERSKELGAVDTVFKTPNGLDLDGHHSTAYDMALITRYAMKNEKFMEIINTPQITVKSDKRTYDLFNKNRLLNEYEGANGVKTGFTGKAGQCFVGSAKRGDMQLISVVLASGWGAAGKEQKWIDTKRLLDYGFNNYKYIDIIKSGDICADVQVTRSKTPEVGIYYKTGYRLPLSEEELSQIKVAANFSDTVKAPVKKGDVMGSATVFMGNEALCEIELLAEESALRHDFITSFKKICIKWLESGTNKALDTDLLKFGDYTNLK